MSVPARGWQRDRVSNGMSNHTRVGLGAGGGGWNPWRFGRGLEWMGLLGLAWLALFGAGCASTSSEAVRREPFRFARDTVGFTNETRWIYMERPGGGMSGVSRETRPDYSLRCFVVARLNRQFFDHARFVPDAAPLADAELRSRIREVIGRSRRTPSGNGPGDRVEIPAYHDLRELSRARESWLKEDGGGAFESYCQRGHWRMLFPFGRSQQERVAGDLVARLAEGRPRVLHLVRFPQLSINHAVLVHGVRETPEGWAFSAADPNDPDQDQMLLFDRVRREFHWPRVPYFPGGRVDVYEVYRNTWY